MRDTPPPTTSTRSPARSHEYLFALKQLAHDCGIDVPFHTMTGWNAVPIPDEGLLPLFGGYSDGFWPVNLDCAGVRLDYATAQPLRQLEANGDHWFFFSVIDGIAPEFAFAGDRPRSVEAGNRVALTRETPGKGRVNFVILPPEQGRQLWKLPLAGRKRAVLSPNTLLLTGIHP